jgi:Carboxypeptidase regulatory-like domain
MRRFMARLFFGLMVASIGILPFLAITPAWAQSTSTGTVTGQVTDPQNAVVPKADVTLRDVATNTARKLATDESGRYIFVNIPPGVYDISVTRTGFKTSMIEGQKVTVGTVRTVDVVLEIGSVSESVQISASAGAELQTTNAAVGKTITGKQLELITNLGRDANVLFVLQPAVAPTGEVAGAVRDQNTYQLDGGNNSDDMAGTTNTYTQAAGFIGSGAAGGTPSGVMPTPAESIEEFKVATNNQSADFNGSAGGQISLVTKRGSNQWHGSAYEHFFGSNFGANTWQNNHTPVKDTAGNIISPFTPLPASHQNRFGASAGGPISPEFLGGKWYMFANYEGRRFPQASPITRTVPTELLRAGVVQVQDSAGVWQKYNLNPVPVTVAGVTYQPARCGAANALCDPRGLGMNPIISQLWTKFMPLPNDPSSGDQHNTQGYLSSVLLPQNADSLVARFDHDFGDKWHFMGSYRYYRLDQLANTQIDIGGALPGSTFGVPRSTAPRQQKPSYYVVGLVTNISPNMTNDFHYNYLRNFWEWGTAAAPPQLDGLGGALELGGESANALIPYNVNTQNVRQRYWDGQDHVIRDDVTWIRRNHMFQFGGMYQRNFDIHQRNDNGQGVMAANVYQITNNPGLASLSPAFTPAGLPSSQLNTWTTYYAQVLGLVTQPQSLYTRKLPDLSLQPLGTPAFDKSVIPSYNAYFSDTWRMKPNFTLSYGMGYMVEMPPFEKEGKQVMLVDTAGNPIVTEDYLAQRKKAALAGQVYNPTLGFATIGNVGGGRKYPYDPFYGGFSPRVAVAWNPKFDSGILGKVFGPGRSVIRAGYNRIFGRLNGVDLVLVPLLGTGLLQPVQCQGAVRAANAVAGSQCLGVNGANPNNAFRIGADGLTAPLPAASNTLPQPFFPATLDSNGTRFASAGGGSTLDPKFRPNVSDQIDFTLQRELIPHKLLVEVGYIGRRIRNEFQPFNLDTVPYMTTLGGQTFADAFKNLFLEMCGPVPTCAAPPAAALNAVKPQPFFETVMGGPTSPFCRTAVGGVTPANCTAAVALNQSSNIRSTLVYSLWNALASSTSWTLGRTLPSSNPPGGCAAGSPVCNQLTSIFMEAANGYGNYNAAFVTMSIRDWHGMTAQSNFTWSHTLGTGAVTQATSSYSVLDPWDLGAMYGPQSFDVRFLFNQSVLWEPRFFKNQKGIFGRLLDGWAFAPLFTARSGFPLRVGIQSGVNANCQSFAQMNCNEGSSQENAMFLVPYKGGNSALKNQTFTGTIGINTNPANGGVGINAFSDPAAVYNGFRRLILGLDHNGGGTGILRGLPTWNLDLSIAKKFTFTERIGMTFLAQFANVLNKFQPDNPSMTLDNPASFGNITTQANTPRQIEFGLRVHF